MDRIKELIEKLNKASEAYYAGNITVMSDFEFDTLYDELVALETETGVIYANSPTQKVGYSVVDHLVKVKHESRMLSLDKTKEIEKLKSFVGNNTAILSWKLDGLTIVLNYVNGELHQAVTRGNGEIGEDVTHNTKFFKNVPMKIKFQGELIIRGEAVISYTEFNKINEVLEDDKKYKNPRNLCSGTVRQLNSEIAAGRNVDFFAFTLVRAEGQDFQNSKVAQLAFISALGFDVVYYEPVTADTVSETVKKFEQNITKNDYASDGLVLTYEDIAYGESLGNTSKFPKDSIAFKWADESAETVLKEIEWNTSRTGLINPIAIFEPVELEGTTVNKASVHNVSVLEALQLGVGDTIKVYKANMIIPQIAENLSKSGTVEIPTQCPVCGSETEIRQAREGKALYCTNTHCVAQMVKAISHYTSRDAMNIEGISESTIEKFVANHFIENYADLYAVGNFEEQIKNMEGFGVKSYTNLVSSIEKSKDTELYHFIYALGINQVGLSNSKLLCSYFKNNIEAIKNCSQEHLLQIEGFGEIIANSILNYFADESNITVMDKALGYLYIKKAEEVSLDDLVLSGKTFVITGDVHIYSNRKELQNKIESLGGKVTSAVSKSTSYLINNDVESSSSKNKKAKELNIPIITEESFQKLINIH